MKKCYFNICYYKTTIKNTGYLIGPFGTEKLIYNGQVVDTTEFKYYLSGGKEIELREEWVNSGCSKDNTYAMQYYDRIGLIGEKTITCNSP